MPQNTSKSIDEDAIANGAIGRYASESTSRPWARSGSPSALPLDATKAIAPPTPPATRFVPLESHAMSLICPAVD